MTTATITTDERPQHERALELANRVRLARAALKRDIYSGRLGVAEVVERVPWEAETMSIAELLRAQDRWGRIRTQRFLRPLAMSESRPVGRLTRRQRIALVEALELKEAMRRG